VSGGCRRLYKPSDLSYMIAIRTLSHFNLKLCLVSRAAILAVDHAMRHRECRRDDTNEARQACDRVFVIGRPPGHHAGPHG
jgi:acetoin utilization deacetylase AcuC-like enzyme